MQVLVDCVSMNVYVLTNASGGQEEVVEVSEEQILQWRETLRQFYAMQSAMSKLASTACRKRMESKSCI